MTEAEARRAIVEYAALLWRRGLVAGTSGNLSYRLDGGLVLVTPAGRALRALRDDELVLVRADGAAAGPGRATSELPLHLAAYRTRPDVRCVVHTHPTYCTAWSKTGALFPLDTVGAIESLGAVAFTAYARSGSVELADRCAAAFALPADAVVMERHGLSTVGATLEDAFARTDLAEQTATIEYLAATLS